MPTLQPRSPKPPRPRGAQPGNTNALRHGFYSKRFQKRELSDLEAASFQGLAEEIAVIRLFNRRLIEKFTPDCDLYDTAYVLRVLCIGACTIDRLLKTQALVTHHSNKAFLDESLEAAIDQVFKELGADEIWSNKSPGSPSNALSDDQHSPASLHPPFTLPPE